MKSTIIILAILDFGASDPRQSIEWEADCVVVHGEPFYSGWGRRLSVYDVRSTGRLLEILNREPKAPVI